MYAELNETGKFDVMDLTMDEEEHSIEMQLPYIAKVMANKKDCFTIVPVFVGAINSHQEQEYGKFFGPYLADPENLFVISSDFCHWGGYCSIRDYVQLFSLHIPYYYPHTKSQGRGFTTHLTTSLKVPFTPL